MRPLPFLLPICYEVGAVTKGCNWDWSRAGGTSSLVLLTWAAVVATRWQTRNMMPRTDRRSEKMCPEPPPVCPRSDKGPGHVTRREELVFTNQNGLNGEYANILPLSYKDYHGCQLDYRRHQPRVLRSAGWVALGPWAQGTVLAPCLQCFFCMVALKTEERFRVYFQIKERIILIISFWFFIFKLF